MIRILHVVTYMGRGGLETMLMNYYRHIDRSQIQFDFLTHRDFRADYDDEIESLGGKLYRLPRLVPWSQSYRKTLNAFFAEHPEYLIVHVHQDCLSSVILKAAKRHGILVRIAHSHSSNQDKNLKYLIKLYYRRQIPQYATQLFACGQEAGEWMFRGAPFQILNNAIDVKQYQYDPKRASQMRSKLGIPEDSFVVGHVGRFSPQKNHEFLVDVFTEIQKIHKNSVLLLVGDGILRTSIEEKANKLGLRDNVIFTGIRSDVPDIMQVMDCFVFPSLYEGLGIVAVEAQASGLPCILSNGVPTECDITRLVKHVDLMETSSNWANIILNQIGKLRLDTSEEVVRAGYDITVNAQWLQNYYLEQWKEVK